MSEEGSPVAIGGLVGFQKLAESISCGLGVWI